MKERKSPLNRPFLKWAGNKFRILERILELLPTGERLVEPFAGSGALFLNSDFPRFLLADNNKDLVDLYTILKNEGKSFVTACRRLFVAENNLPDRYYLLRDEFNGSVDPLRRATLFVYLNRHGYNGLCRYNSSGGFNVPFGRYRRPYFPEKEMMLFHEKAQRAEFRHDDFIKVMAGTRPGDVLYCDPPYVPLSASANFTSYSAGGFGLEQQRSLAEAASRLAGRGIPVLISNHSTDFTRQSYRGATIREFPVSRSISCNAECRGEAPELLALFASQGSAE